MACSGRGRDVKVFGGILGGKFTKSLDAFRHGAEVGGGCSTASEKQKHVRKLPRNALRSPRVCGGGVLLLSMGVDQLSPSLFLPTPTRPSLIVSRPYLWYTTRSARHTPRKHDLWRPPVS